MVKFRVRLRVRSRVKIRVRIRVRVSVSYIMTIWRWEEFSRCDKFPTTPVAARPPAIVSVGNRLASISNIAFCT